MAGKLIYTVYSHYMAGKLIDTVYSHYMAGTDEVGGPVAMFPLHYTWVETYTSFLETDGFCLLLPLFLWCSNPQQ